MPYFGELTGKQIRVAIPPEFADETALLTYLNLGISELGKIWWYRERMYQYFAIAKSSGKARHISAPNARLKFLQRMLAVKLSELYRPRKPVHGFVAGKSIKTNALSHLRRRYVVNIDLKEFFPTITEGRVKGMLDSLGVDDRVAAIIARICCSSGHLPQGSPSSPILSNMICFRLDKRLMAVAKEARCIYTRYADDISFSSHQPPTVLFEPTLPPAGHFSPELLAPMLRDAIEQNGFTINPEKAHYADRHSRRTVTGIKVNELLNVDRRYIRNIRATLHSIKTLGIENAEQKFKDKYGGGQSSLAAYLQGKISFLIHIKGQSDPVVRSIALRYNRCFPDRQIEVQPTREERINRSVWVIEHGCIMKDTYRQGSVFFLEGVGLVTAAHCVEGVKEAIIHHPSRPSNKHKVAVIHYSKHRDLAVLSHKIPETDFYQLVKSAVPAATGDPVTAAGYPDFGPGDKINLRHGTVSSTAVKSLIAKLEVNFKLAQGMSGGPVLNGNDAVVGIVHKGGPEMLRDFAIMISELDKWMEDGFPSDY